MERGHDMVYVCYDNGQMSMSSDGSYPQPLGHGAKMFRNAAPCV